MNGLITGESQLHKDDLTLCEMLYNRNSGKTGGRDSHAESLRRIHMLYPDKKIIFCSTLPFYFLFYVFIMFHPEKEPHNQSEKMSKGIHVKGKVF